MVTRKGSLPYPSSPPATHPKSDPFIQNSASLMVDSADLPPIPNTYRQGDPTGRESAYGVDDNPWNDHTSPKLRSDRPLPDLLKPRNGRPVETEKQHSMKDIPQTLRDEHSGQATPRSSMESDRSKDFWEDDQVDDNEIGRESPGKSPHLQPDTNTASASLDPLAVPTLPFGIKRKPVGSASSSQPDLTATEPAHDFASNNPFRHVSSTQGTQPPQYGGHLTEDLPNWGDDKPSLGKGKAVELKPWASTLPTTQFSDLNVHSSTVPDLSSYSNADSGTQQWQENVPDAPPQPHAPPPPIPPQPRSPFSEQPPLIPVSPSHAKQPNPWDSQPQLGATPPPAAFDQSQKYATHQNGSMLDPSQHTGIVSLGSEVKPLPSVVDKLVDSQDEPSLLDDDETGPPLPKRPAVRRPGSMEANELYAPPDGPPPTKPPRPLSKAAVTSDEEVARMIEQRNETYQIKHFNWFDHGSGRLRRSSMLTQNKNGPCPLLALVNALILGAKHESQAVLDDALRSREQVSLGLIIETLMDELLSRGYQSGAGSLPDVDELNRFLMRLRTGMNANPRFVPPAVRAPNIMDARNSMLHLPQSERAQQRAGTFEATPDLKLYGAFEVPLLHGWIPEPGSDAAEAFARSAQTYEDAQALQFGEEELEYKLTRGGLSRDEQRIWEDINSIKTFLKLYPTQLTPHGLESVKEVLSSGSFAIMFRNDHFSTIYKHPQSGQLFTLITDAGYADRDEIIWESLVDLSGKHSEFFSGDFMPVSHQQAGDAQTSSGDPLRARRSSQHLSADAAHQPPLSPQEQQEQHDADFAMALQLQEEEEQRQRAEQSRRRSNANSSSNSGNNGRGSSGNIPIPLRSAAQRAQDAQNQQNEIRPLIPPRHSRSQVQGVNRPTDALDDDAPPAYEEAAKGRPYIPPLGSPLHPSADPAAPGVGISPMSSNGQLTGTISNVSNPGGQGQTQYPPPGIDGRPGGPSNSAGGRAQRGRRQSAYGEQALQHQQMQMPGGYYPGDRDRDRDPRRQRMGRGASMSGYPGSGAGPSGRDERDRDCIVM